MLTKKVPYNYKTYASWCLENPSLLYLHKAIMLRLALTVEDKNRSAEKFIKQFNPEEYSTLISDIKDDLVWNELWQSPFFRHALNQTLPASDYLGRRESAYEAIRVYAELQKHPKDTQALVLSDSKYKRINSLGVMNLCFLKVLHYVYKLKSNP